MPGWNIEGGTRVALRILLAESNIAAQKQGMKILASAGHDVTTVSNGLAAIKRIADFHPNVLLLDVYLPGYDGIEVCEKVKATSEMAPISVLLTAGKMEPFRAAECKKSKADGFVTKPFEAGELIVAVEKLAERIHPAEAVTSRCREVCDVCGYINQENAFACQNCDVPLPSSVMSSRRA
jgi:CheY-like chemotaxis protein